MRRRGGAEQISRQPLDEALRRVADHLEVRRDSIRSSDLRSRDGQEVGEAVSDRPILIGKRDYSQGTVGILSVLEAQRRAFSARNSEISLRNQRLQNRIDLHLALGGDFEEPPPREPAGDDPVVARTAPDPARPTEAGSN